MSGSRELFKICQGSTCFGYWVNLCCNRIICEVPTIRILVQTVLEALEVSGKARGTVSTEGGFHFMGCLG
jgi:hypothetical protein